MFNVKDPERNLCMLDGPFASQGYDWWWHSFTAISERTGEERQFFIEYFLCNPALGGSSPVFGQLPENRKKGRCPSYLMIKAGCWGEQHAQLHRFFGWRGVRISDGVPYYVSAENCYASDCRLRGSVEISPEMAAGHPEWMCDSGSMQWDLSLNKQTAFNVGYGAGKTFRNLHAFEMYWHAEGMKTAYSGTVVFNGEIFHADPERSFGYADKNWGSSFTSPWLWLSSSDLTSRLTGKRLENSVFDLGGGRPKAFGIDLGRILLGAFLYEGQELEYNFSKLGSGAKSAFWFSEQQDEVVWHVTMENNETVMETEARCRKKDMLFVNYEAPNGEKRHNRLFNGGNGWGEIKLWQKNPWGKTLIDDIAVGHIGCEYGEYDK